MGGILSLAWKSRRLIAYALVGVVIVWMLLQVRGWHRDSLALPAVKAQAAQEVAQARAAADALRRAYSAAQAASKGYQDELATIRNAPRPTGVIRVCKPAARLPASRTDPGRSGPAATPAGVVPAADELAVGPLYDLADRCDGLSAQVRALQELK